MAEAWVGIAKTTLSQYIRREEPAALRRRVILAMLEKRGRIKMNASGKDMDWPVKYRRAGLRAYEDFEALVFQRMNRHQRPVLNWGAYEATEAYSKLDELRNRGKEALVRKISEIGETLMEDAREGLHAEMYTRQQTSGNSNKFGGLESIFSNTGSVATGNSKVFVPNDTYAGLSTALQNFGGSWDVDGSGNSKWPDGSGDIAYEFWSPVMIDYRSTGFSSTQTWKANCIPAMRYAITCADRNESAMSDKFFLIDRTMLSDFKDEQQLKEKIEVTSDTPVRSLGFSTVRFDGYDVTSEYGVPASTSTNDNRVGYLVDISGIELQSLNDTVFSLDGPEWSIERQAHLIVVFIAGQLRFTSPRHQTKLLAS